MPSTVGMDPTPFNDTDSTRRFERALVFAARTHAGTNRKGTTIPYITHPVQVARILERYGFDEGLVIAGLLHDVIEDENVPPEKLEEDFGHRVRALVCAVTEKKADESGAARPWGVRKREQLDHLNSAAPEIAALKAADALHNLTTIIADLDEHGDTVWARFNAGPAALAGYYAEVASVVRRKLGEHPLAKALAQTAATFSARCTAATRNETLAPEDGCAFPDSSQAKLFGPGEIVFWAEQFPNAINGLVVPDEEFSPEPGVRILAPQPPRFQCGGTPSLYMGDRALEAWTREVLRRGYPDAETARAAMPGD
jgi:hypothetical protein